MSRGVSILHAGPAAAVVSFYFACCWLLYLILGSRTLMSACVAFTSWGSNRSAPVCGLGGLAPLARLTKSYTYESFYSRALTGI